jgi:hypothetical protein
MTDLTKIVSEEYKKLTKEKLDEYETKYKGTKQVFLLEKR